MYKINNTTKHSVLDILYTELSMQYFLETRSQQGGGDANERIYSLIRNISTLLYIIISTMRPFINCCVHYRSKNVGYLCHIYCACDGFPIKVKQQCTQDIHRTVA